jgi:hypothetical protein
MSSVFVLVSASAHTHVPIRPAHENMPAGPSAHVQTLLYPYPVHGSIDWDMVLYKR